MQPVSRDFNSWLKAQPPAYLNFLHGIWDCVVELEYPTEYTFWLGENKVNVRQQHTHGGFQPIMPAPHMNSVPEWIHERREPRELPTQDEMITTYKDLVKWPRLGR